MKRLLFLLGALWALGISTCVQAWADDAEVSQVQAAYIFNFIKFTTWPAAAPETKPFRIRIFQNQIVTKAMSEAPEQSVHNRPFDIRNCNAAAELTDAELVFIPAKAAPAIPHEIWSSFGQATMVISDWDEIFAKGGTVQFLTVGGKIRFAINLKHSKELNISSKLLRLATEVTE